MSADAAAFMADSQVPWGLAALDGAVSEPAWRTKPSWYLVSTEADDSARRAARDVEARRFNGVEAKGSHAVYVSQPKAVADSSRRPQTRWLWLHGSDCGESRPADPSAGRDFAELTTFDIGWNSSSTKSS